MIPVTADEILRLLPLLIPAGASLIALLVAAFSPDDRRIAPVVAAVGALAAITAMALWGWKASTNAGPMMGGMIAMDFYALFFTFLILAMLVGANGLAVAGLRAKDYAHGEYWALMLFAACGAILLVSSTNLLLMFVGIEVMSVSIYALVGSDRNQSRPPEAALKYFLLGAFSSAFLLFGIAFVYGATGSLDLAVIREAVRVAPDAGHHAQLRLGTALMLVGFAFKTSTAPFHMWTPDAYTGAPTTVTAFMASAVKAASFAAFVRVFAAALGPTAGFWSDLVAVAAGLTVIVGNLGAIAQSEIKRMLAYSGIAHAGYLLIGLRAGSIDPGAATPAILYYLFAYTFTSLGAFGVVVAVERWKGRELAIDDLAGLSQKHPLIAAAMAVFMLALAGVPPTAGFTAKLYVFTTTVKIGDYALAVIGVLGSAISLWYYLRVIVVMYMREPVADDGVRGAGSAEPEPDAVMPSVLGVVAISVLVVMVAGIAPDWYFRLSRVAAASSIGAIQAK